MRIATLTTASHVDRPAATGIYSYKVRALDASGNRSAFSESVTGQAISGQP